MSKKGIQQVVAVIMLTALAMSMITLLYFHLNRMRDLAMSGTENQTENFNNAINMKITIDNVGENVIYVRNTGNNPIPNSSVNLYIDGKLTPFSMDGSMDPGDTKALYFETPMEKGRQYIVKVTAGRVQDSAIFNAPRPTTGLYGYIKDEDGIPVAGVNVTVKGTVFSVLTDENGYYNFSAIPPGKYDQDNITFSLFGYESISKNATIHSFDSTKVSVSLVMIKKTPPCYNMSLPAPNGYGDIDGDGDIDVIDHTLTSQLANSIILCGSYSNDCEKADVNNIGGVTMTDVMMQGQYLYGTRYTFPVCEVSYNYRSNVTITNNYAAALNNYQVKFSINTLDLINAGHMKPDCSDIRIFDYSTGSFVNFYMESGCNTPNTVIWAKTSLTSGGTKTISVLFGNPTSLNYSNSTSTFENIFQEPGFERVGSWIRPISATNCRSFLPSIQWKSEGAYSLYVYCSVSRTTLSYYYVSQAVSLGAGTEYKIIFDSEVLFNSNSYGSANITLNNAFGTSVWSINTITSNLEMLNQETFPIPSATTGVFFGTECAPSSPTLCQVHVMFDNLRVRKYVSPEPSVTAGVEELNT